MNKSPKIARKGEGAGAPAVCGKDVGLGGQFQEPPSKTRQTTSLGALSGLGVRG